MRKSWLLLILLLVTAFSLATRLESWFQTWAGNRAGSANLLAVAFGDGRKLFARHIYLKADAYYHRGYYPSIYDTAQQQSVLRQQSGLESNGGTPCKGHNAGEPLDWLDSFSRYFYPSRHTHLGEALSADPNLAHSDKGQDDGSGKLFAHQVDPKLQAEILPWLRISAGLDPNRVETFVIAAFWLRRQLGKIDEAEAFLREGLRANPGSQEILFELGRIYYEDRKDPNRARNLWELALKSWHEREGPKEDPDIFLYAQILGNLGRLEDEQKNYAQAIVYLEKLASISPHAPSIRKWIAELKAKRAQPSAE